MDNITSSYKANRLGETLYNVVLEYKPKTIVEFGVLEGFSTIHMAKALRELDQGHIFAYDLWDAYKFKHNTQAHAQKNIDEAGLTDLVTLLQLDFYEWLEDAENQHFDLLHLDVSNCGDIIEKTIQTLEKAHKGRILLFEGGSKTRDEVDWMIRFNKRPINPVVQEYGCTIIDENFPSLSMKML